MIRWLIVLLVPLALGGCGSDEPVIDTTSKETLRSSLEKAENSLEPDRRVEFRGALVSLVVADRRAGGVMLGVGPDEGSLALFRNAGLHGKTAEEVIQAVKSLGAQK